MMIVQYDKVIELPKSQFPMYDYCDEHGEKGTDNWIFISDRYIQFRAPLVESTNSKIRPILTLNRLDDKTVYSKPNEKATWSVIKSPNGITLWPSINYGGNGNRQHFWFKDMKAQVLGDSWKF